jgi:predicted cytidylate kinase
MSFRAITISGEIATGKSTLVNQLLLLLPTWSRVNTGQRLRDYCISKGMNVLEVSFVPDSIHREFDAIAKNMLETEKNIIVEGRMSGWLARDLEDVFRIYCFAPLKIRAERYIMRDKVGTIEKAEADITYRETKDVEKFRNVYGVNDFRDPSFYQLRLDTSTGSPSDLAQLVIKKAGLKHDE